MTADPSKFYLETTEGVIIEDMGNLTDFRAWIYPPSRDNYWAWAAGLFFLLFGFGLMAAWLMPIRSDAAPVTLPQSAPTPKTSVGPNLKPMERQRDGF